MKNTSYYFIIIIIVIIILYLGPGQHSRYSDSLRAEVSGVRTAVVWNFPYPSTLPLRPTQPPVQWAPGPFRNRPDGHWGPPNLLYNGHLVLSGRKAAKAWTWPPTPFLRRSPVWVQLYFCLLGMWWDTHYYISKFHFIQNVTGLLSLP